MQTCTKCNIEKSFEEYGLQRGKVRKICKECRKIESKEWYANNKERKKELSRQYKHIKKDQHLQKSYGISIQDYVEMCESQNYECKLCKKQQSAARALCVDHCHTTGKIRGLLCDNCNRGLGLLGDTKEHLYNAYLYLRDEEEL